MNYTFECTIKRKVEYYNVVVKDNGGNEVLRAPIPEKVYTGSTDEHQKYVNYFIVPRLQSLGLL